MCLAHATVSLAVSFTHRYYCKGIESKVLTGFTWASISPRVSSTEGARLSYEMVFEDSSPSVHLSVLQATESIRSEKGLPHVG